METRDVEVYPYTYLSINTLTSTHGYTEYTGQYSERICIYTSILTVYVGKDGYLVIYILSDRDSVAYDVYNMLHKHSQPCPYQRNVC